MGILCVNGVSGAIFDSSLDTGLTDYFRLDETSGTSAKNLVRNDGHTGNFWVTGQINNSYNLSAATMNITNESDYDYLFNFSGAFSVSFWTKPKNLGSGQIFMSKGLTGSDRFYIGTSSNKLRVLSLDSNFASDFNAMQSTDDLTLDTWNHIVVVYNDGGNVSNVSIYINGSLQTANVEKDGRIITNIVNNYNVSFGVGEDGSNTYRMNASIDEIGFWNRSLTAAEVTTLWNDGNGLPTIDFAEVQQTFNATTEISKSEDFVVNISYISDRWTSVTANLNWNGTNYTGTQVGTGNSILFRRTLEIPNVAGISSSVNFHWIFTFTNSSGSFTYGSSTKSQSLNPINLTECNSTQVPFINFTVREAVNPYPVLNATFKSSWRVRTSSGGSVYANFSYENITETSYNFPICIDPQDENYTISADIEIDGTGYAKNFHYLVNLSVSNTTSNINLYLLNDSDATATVLEVLDAGQQAMEDVYIQYQLYDVGTDTFYTVGMARTDHNGEDLVYLNWYDTLYKFILTRDGTTLLSTNPYKVSETPQTFEVIAAASYDFEKFEDFEYSLYYNSSTQNFVLTFVKPSGDVEQGCLRVIKRNQSGDTQVCLSCESSSSATVYCNIANEGNGTFIGSFYATGSFKLIDTISQLIGVASQVYDELGNLDGTVMAIVLAGLVMAFFLISPALAVIGIILGTLAAYAIGFQPIEYYTFIGLVIVGGIVLWILNK